jgi:hypothetical protein
MHIRKNSVLRRIFGYKREEATRNHGKLSGGDS